MSDLTNKVVTCRKDYKCEWCGESINKGEKAHYRAGVFDGNFYSGHEHPECYEAMGSSSKEAIEQMQYEGFAPHEQMRGKTYDESHGL